MPSTRIPEHRRIPGRSGRTSKSSRRYEDDESLLSAPPQYFDGSRSPRELLAMGAVLDHLCRGGQVSESTRVFFKEANRGSRRRSRSFDWDPRSFHHQKERPPPSSLDSETQAPTSFPFIHSPTLESFSCISACQSPDMRDDHDDDTFKIVGEVDEDGYTIPSRPRVLLNEDAKRSQEEETAYYTLEDSFVTYDDNTYDNRTWRGYADDMETIAGEDGTVLNVANGKSFQASIPIKLPPIDFEPAMLEQYIDEENVDEDILGEIAHNLALINRNIHQLVQNPPAKEEINPGMLLFGTSFDDWDLSFGHGDDKSVNSLAKKMHTMLQRKSSRLFATSDTKGNGQRAVVARKKSGCGKNGKSKNHPDLKELRCTMAAADADDYTFAEYKQGDDDDEEEQGFTSPYTNAASILANASSKPWATFFPAKPITAPIVLKPLDEDHISGMRFVSHDNQTLVTETSTASPSDNVSRAASTPTVVRGNGVRQQFSGKIQKKRTLSSPDRTSSLPPRVPSTPVPVAPSLPLGGPPPAPRRFSSSPARSSGRSTVSTVSTGTDSVSVCGHTSTTSMVRKRSLFGRRPSKPSSAMSQFEGVLEADDAAGFEVQQVDQTRLEI